MTDYVSSGTLNPTHSLTHHAKPLQDNSHDLWATTNH